jgi:hypothetical protein
VKYLNTFEKALPISTAKKYVSEFKKDRYKEEFQRAKEEYDGDRNAYRIYLPLIDEETDKERYIREYLDTIEFEIVDYLIGTCRRKGAKNTSKIGQILTRNNRTDLLNYFNTDLKRKYGPLEVCVSRHAYDVAGADTDRKWSDCMTIGVVSSKVKKMQKQIEKIQNDKKEIDKEIEIVAADALANLQNVVLNNRRLRKIREKLAGKEGELETTPEEKKRYVKSSITRYKKSLAIEEEKELVNYKRNIINEITQTDGRVRELVNKKNRLDRDIDNISYEIRQKTTDGCNVRYVLQDVIHGSLEAYLIKKTDRNITDPIANLNIKPYLSVLKNEDYILVADDNCYGEGSASFKKTVKSFLKKYWPHQNGIYMLNANLYRDNTDNMVYKSPEFLDATELFEYYKNLLDTGKDYFMSNLSYIIRGGRNNYFENKHQIVYDKFIDLLIETKDPNIIKILSSISYEKKIKLYQSLDLMDALKIFKPDYQNDYLQRMVGDKFEKKPFDVDVIEGKLEITYKGENVLPYLKILRLENYTYLFNYKTPEIEKLVRR